MFPNQKKKAGFVPSKGKKKAGPPPAASPAAPPVAPDADGDDDGDAGPIEAATKSYDTATQTFRKGGKKKAK